MQSEVLTVRINSSELKKLTEVIETIGDTKSNFVRNSILDSINNMSNFKDFITGNNIVETINDEDFFK